MITTSTNINTVTKHQSLASSSLPTLKQIPTTKEVNPELPKNLQRHLETQPSMPPLLSLSNSPQIVKSKIPSDQPAEKTATTIPLPNWLKENRIDSIETQTLITNLTLKDKEIIIDRESQQKQVLKLTYDEGYSFKVNIDHCKNSVFTEFESLPILIAVLQFFDKGAYYFKTKDEILRNRYIAIIDKNNPQQPGKMEKFSMIIAVNPPKDQPQAPLRLIHMLNIPLDPDKDRKFIEELINRLIDGYYYLLPDIRLANDQVADYLEMPLLKLIDAIEKSLKDKDPTDFIEKMDEPTEAGKKLYAQIQELISFLDDGPFKNDLTKLAGYILKAGVIERTTINGDIHRLFRPLDSSKLGKIKYILREITKIILKDFFRKQEEGAEIDEEYKDKTLKALITKTLSPPKLAT